MNNLSTYIIEKLLINKDTKIIERPNNIRKIWLPDPIPQDVEKMKYYRNKGSKPTTLVNTIKDKEKFLRRLKQAIRMKWPEAIKAFVDGAVNRNYYTREELEQYLDGINDE